MQAKLTGGTASERSESRDQLRARLIEGFMRAVGVRGYGAVTIADIVGHAHVSKRTFYEHFADKEQCFLAAYDDATTRLLAGIALAVDGDAPWEAQIGAAVQAYLVALDAEPALARTFLLEIQAAGGRAVKARRLVHERFAEQIRGFVEAARRRDKSLRPLAPEMAAALVGGINELVLLNLESGATRLSSLGDTAARFATAVLLAGTTAAPAPRARRPAAR